MAALLTCREAATILRLSTRTLERLRCAGTGPKFIRIGKSIRYEHGALWSYVTASVVASPPLLNGPVEPLPTTVASRPMARLRRF